jgi:hypothetical protein
VLSLSPPCKTPNIFLKNPTERNIKNQKLKINKSKNQKIKKPKGQKVKRLKGQKVKRSKGQKVKRSKGQKVKGQMSKWIKGKDLKIKIPAKSENRTKKGNGERKGGKGEGDKPRSTSSRKSLPAPSSASYAIITDCKIIYETKNKYKYHCLSSPSPSLSFPLLPSPHSNRSLHVIHICPGTIPSTIKKVIYSIPSLFTHAHLSYPVLLPSLC